jgi:hypothetical protein
MGLGQAQEMAKAISQYRFLRVDISHDLGWKWISLDSGIMHCSHGGLRFRLPYLAAPAINSVSINLSTKTTEHRTAAIQSKVRSS